MTFSGAVLAAVLAHGLASLVEGHPHPPGWQALYAEGTTTVILERRVAHCPPRLCRAVVVTFDPSRGGQGTLLTRTGHARCRFAVEITVPRAPVCVRLSGCSLEGEACSAP